MLLWVNLVAALGGGAWYFLQPPERQDEVRRLVGNSFADNKNVTAMEVAWDVYQFYYSADFVTTPPAAGERTHVYGGAPRVAGEGDAIPAGRFLRNIGYLVGYDDDLGSPRWAAYRVADMDRLPAAGPRPGGFEVDARTVARIDPDVYTGSGFDRGHLAPNYAIATRHGAAAQRETFLMSNVMPQRHGLNAGLWKQVEMRVATNWPARYGEVWVVAGPVFGAKPARLEGLEGGSGPAIPEACYMIVVDESGGRVRTLAFLFPQEPAAGAKMDEFLTTVDEIERRTRLDFFAELPLETETELEGRRAGRVW